MPASTAYACTTNGNGECTAGAESVEVVMGSSGSVVTVTITNRFAQATTPTTTTTAAVRSGVAEPQFTG